MGELRISLATIILPRLEVFFLEEWIEHHLLLGVNRIYIYDNGLKPVASKDAHWKVYNSNTNYELPEEASHKWEKKPCLNYFEKYTDEEIYQKLSDIENKFSQVRIIPWVCGVNHEYGYPNSQGKMWFNCTDRFKSDWWLNLDPDEYMMLKKYDNLHEMIQDNSGITYFNFVAKGFHFRQFGEVVRGNYKCVLAKNHHPNDWPLKWMAKMSASSDILYYANVHKIRIKNMNVKKFSGEDDVLFHHYCRYPHDTHTDDSMKKYINNS